MKNKLLGCILLIIGTSIGGGMLALPVVTASGGFFHSVILLVAAWLAMTVGALFMAEVNLWFHRDNNIVSMARITLGKAGEVIAWITYLGLLYALISAYIAGGSGVLQSILSLAHIDLPDWSGAIAFTLILGIIVWRGIDSVDKTNRLLMSVKLFAFIAIVALLTKHIQWTNLNGGHIKSLFPAVTVVVTSFGFAGSIPSFCSYLDYDRTSIRKAIWIGSSVTLIAYIVWLAAAQGTISAHDLNHMNLHGNTTEMLTQRLSSIAHNPWLSTFAHLFASICMFTSFIGVSLGLSDFLADGMRVKKSENKLLVYGVTFVPPLLITWFYPKIFISALGYAGICCLILLMLLPGLMAWSGRYRKTSKNRLSFVKGGKVILAIEIIIAIIFLIMAIVEKIAS